MSCAAWLSLGNAGPADQHESGPRGLKAARAPLESTIDRARSEAADPPAVRCPPSAAAAVHCAVSEAVFRGWHTYHAVSMHCHGQDGLGGSFASNLVATVGSAPRDDFLRIVLDGYDGRVGRMPGYRGNPNVEPTLDDLYEYLVRRASGELPRGRPARPAGLQ